MNPYLIAGAVGALLLLSKPAQAVARKAALASALDDNAQLMTRATQPRAAAWAADFEAAGAGPALAAALSRWTGIESGGNPNSHSVLDERGLLQVGPRDHGPGKAVTDAEWEALLDPETPRATHADIALHAWQWYAKEAEKFVKGMPPEPIDRIFYAKLRHQRPLDLKHWRMHGPARLMSMSQEGKLRGQPKTLHRLHAANIIAFGDVSPNA